MSALRPFLFVLFALSFCAGPTQATTWDEPWHREVVGKATAFGLYEVVKSDSASMTLKRLKHISGQEAGPTVEVNAFYALRLTSRSADHGPEFRLPAGQGAYFHLKREGNAWAIAKPTAGYAPVGADGRVFATYRFSAHQAMADAGLYEDTQRCIFEVLHGAAGCDVRIAKFIDAQLAGPAEGIIGATNEGREAFFRQHVALETAGFIHYPLQSATLEPFLSKQDVHVQISALRALAASPHADKVDRLMRFVEEPGASPPARIVAVLLLKDIGARGMKQRLLDYAARASEEEAGLGIALMDPRIGTSFPATLKQAVMQTVEQL